MTKGLAASDQASHSEHGESGSRCRSFGPALALRLSVASSYPAIHPTGRPITPSLPCAPFPTHACPVSHLRTHLLLPGHEALILPPQALLRREELSPAQIQGKGNAALPLRRRYVKEWMDMFQTLLNDTH